MILFAAVHLHPVWSISFAAMIALWMIWYWMRLGRADVPSSRRKLRRTSLAIMLLTLPMFVRALSFLDPITQQREYIMTWSMAFLMMLIVIVFATADVMNTLRLVHRQAHDEMREAAIQLSEAIKQREQTKRIASQHRPTQNGNHNR